MKKVKMNRRLIICSIVFFFLIIGCGEEPGTGLVPPILILPEDGSIISENPPIFVWETVHYDKCEILYLLEVSTDEQFNVGSIVYSTVIVPPDTTHIPNTSFASGDYYWHICIRENA